MRAPSERYQQQILGAASEKYAHTARKRSTLEAIAKSAAQFARRKQGGSIDAGDTADGTRDGARKPPTAQVAAATRRSQSLGEIAEAAAPAAPVDLRRCCRPTWLDPQSRRCAQRRILSVEPANPRPGIGSGFGIVRRLPRGVRLTAAGEVFVPTPGRQFPRSRRSSRRSSNCAAWSAVRSASLQSNRSRANCCRRQSRSSRRHIETSASTSVSALLRNWHPP